MDNLMGLGVGLSILAFLAIYFVCWIWVLIAMFRSGFMTGICGLFCGIYLLYWGWVYWDSPQKTIVMGVITAMSVLGVVARIVGAGMGHHTY
jgi:hypothetical protein